MAAARCRSKPASSRSTRAMSEHAPPLEDDPDFTILLERDMRPRAELPEMGPDGPPRE